MYVHIVYVIYMCVVFVCIYVYSMNVNMCVYVFSVYVCSVCVVCVLWSVGLFLSYHRVKQTPAALSLWLLILTLH